MNSLLYFTQIDSADKQLKSTRKFQEEEAIEREAERDEALKQIKVLQERLKEKERERDRDWQSKIDEVSSKTLISR